MKVQQLLFNDDGACCTKQPWRHVVRESIQLEVFDTPTCRENLTGYHPNQFLLQDDQVHCNIRSAAARLPGAPQRYCVFQWPDQSRKAKMW